ncbi:MAG: tRNA (adenosine(37)-N6)-dimethylallyltransferase MiaA [Bacteroidales bacterium]|jgi:tRNA dimethylallyltransferase|nr:tRNA (adenosine(37)-N6)-dimethylallyltransferase MiaA [Bacteroidales bacterium]
MIVVLGPTATGKTAVATHLAYKIDGEIISADSRQVFRGMNIGTGKDLNEYVVNGKSIPYHLIDIAEPGEEYSVFQFQQDFLSAWSNIRNRKKTVILCGGTGFYIESVLKQYQLAPVPNNPILRYDLESISTEKLIAILSSMRTLHNTTDIEDRKRLMRAIEIETYYQEHPEMITQFPEIDAMIFGISFERGIVRDRITQRLHQRLNEGMIEEVKCLLQQGVSPEKLIFYGLEYRYLMQYIMEKINYDEMFRLLNTAIHQFAKRQMTWFRKMEREGINIQWIDDTLTFEEKADFIIEKYKHRFK